MNDLGDSTLSRTDAQPNAALVPAAFAEKAMATVMQLHGELMEEKERRVDLYRRLMEKEQAVAELRMYVRMLEEKAGIAAARAESPASRAAAADPATAEVGGPSAPRSQRISATVTNPPPPAARAVSAAEASAPSSGARAPAASAGAPNARPPSPPAVGAQRVVNEGWRAW